jgi:endoglucanase
MPTRNPNFTRPLLWLRDLTALPTAPGHEVRVEAWVRKWVAARPDLSVRQDSAGNLLITRKQDDRRADRRSRLWITAHMDHPAFVVLGRPDGREVEVEFRGGVREAYLRGARIDLLDSRNRAFPARMAGLDPNATPFPRGVAVLDGPAPSLRSGDIGRWRFAGGSGAVGFRNRQLRAHACDDLAGLAAALSALDRARGRQNLAPIGVLLTRAEEIGFLGAIAACRDPSIRTRDRLLCLEASRSFPDSPLGGGPILRVGDRAGTFDPDLTYRIGVWLRRHEETSPGFRWQRRLMSGGTCEASAFCAYGFRAACACLPLEAYHNMDDPDTTRSKARAVPERIDLNDYLGLIELITLVAEGLTPPSTPSLRTMLNRQFAKRHPFLDY